jgi:hypothetical protein
MPLANVKSTQTQEACNPDPLRDLDSAGWKVGLPPSFEPWELPRVHQLARHQASSTWSMLARALRHQHLTSAAPAAAAASAACQQRCALGGSAAAAHPTHSCILPSVGHASLQPPLLSSGCVQGWPGGAPAGGALVVSPALRLFHCNRPSVLTLAWPCCCCCRPEYADSVWELLASFFPNRQASPPICISISAGPHGSPADAQLRGAGFAVIPLLLRPGELSPSAAAALASNGRRPCCLEEPPVSGPAAAAGNHPTASQATWHAGQADVVLFSDVMDMLDTRRALQAAHRHLAREGLVAVLWTDRDLASRFVVELEELLEAAVPGGQAGRRNCRRHRAGRARQAGRQDCRRHRAGRAAQVAGQRTLYWTI